MPVLSEPGARSERGGILRAMRGRCPRCGRGRLFSGYLEITKQCPACGLGFQGHDVGDGPVVPATFLLGGLVVGLALALEMWLSPPLWVHALLWAPAVVGGTLLVLRPLKGLAVGMQYRLRSTEEPPQPGGQ